MELNTNDLRTSVGAKIALLEERTKEGYWDPSWFEKVIESHYSVHLEELAKGYKKGAMNAVRAVLWQGFVSEGDKFQGKFKGRWYSGVVSQEVHNEEYTDIIRVELYRPFDKGKNKINRELVRKINKRLVEKIDHEYTKKLRDIIDWM